VECDDERTFLLDAAAWQDSLLQSYRALHVTVSSILLAIGIGLTVVQLSAPSYPGASASVVVSTFLLTGIAALHWFSSRRFSALIRARGLDINWWHARLITWERSLAPASRHFTAFKIHQQARRADVEHLETAFLESARDEALGKEDIALLIGKGVGHTRQVVDRQLLLWIDRIWFALIVVVWAGPIVPLLT
jgi:hypothetical protein